MNVPIVEMVEAEGARVALPEEDAGLGALSTERGNLPLDRVDIRADITGLTSRVELTQDFLNAFDEPLEATYVFPLPDRGAVTGMRMTADGREVIAELQERGAARQAYDEAVSSGRRASIAEEERPDVFTMRVGNIQPGERVSVAITVVLPLVYADGEATFRLPLVVAPRYIPGAPLPGAAVGDGHADDTDAVPDASRITPPVLLPGFPNPVGLSIDVGIDPAGLTLAEVRSSLHPVQTADGRIRVLPGERLNRDFVLRLRYGGDDVTDSLALVPDTGGAGGEEGTYRLTVLPPVSAAPPRPRDVVLVLDRSGSMRGWKMVAARRAAARIVDTLTTGDRLAVLTFDNRIDWPAGLPEALVEASDRNRYRAVEHLARVDARGGTEMLTPLRTALALLDDARDGRDAVIVLVTDGQVGNEDQILHALAGGIRDVRVHTVGIDRAVNSGFLGRLAGMGGGRCELVESEDRLDEAMDAIHRRIGAPLVHGLRLEAEGLATIDGTASPARLPDLFPGVPLEVTGRYRSASTGSLVLRGTTRDGREWSTTVTGQRGEASAITAQWARAHLRDLEDSYAADRGSPDLERTIVDTSLRFGVLCRFTAYVAVDSRVVAAGGEPHRVVQPVETPSGWEPPIVLASSLRPGSAPSRMAAPVEAAPGSAGDFPASRARLAGPGAPSGSAPNRSLRGGPPPRVRKSPPRAAKAAGADGRLSKGGGELDAAREQVRDEWHRMRDAGPLADYERRDWLDDLATRLAALLRSLTHSGVPGSEFAELQTLVDAIEAGGPLDPLWAEAVRVLEAFAEGGKSPR